VSVTPEFGWPLIEPTDFVTNLPADFETFADAVDDDLKGLNGGTTGQVLTKDSATDLDFSWSAPTAGGYTVLASGNLSGSSVVSLTSIDQGYRDLRLALRNVSASVNSLPKLTLNNITTNNYNSWRAAGASGITDNGTQDGINLSPSFLDNTDTFNSILVEIKDYAIVSNVAINWYTNILTSAAARLTVFGNGMFFDPAAAVSRIDITNSGANNWDAGSYVLFGVK
jgi:hypothetical protein